MLTWLQSWEPWGTEWIRWVQTWHTPWLTTLMKVVTAIGSSDGYMLLFPLIYWCVNEGWGRRIGMLTLASLSLNTTLKLAFGLPRPAAPAVKVLAVEDSLAFPSGHAQGTLSIWGYLAVLWRSWPVRIGLVLLILLIGLSRIYLGAHYPRDIVGGWGLALATLLLFVWLEPHVSPRLRAAPLWLQILLAVAIPAVFWAFSPTDKTQIAVCSAWVGVNLGIIVDLRVLRYSAAGSYEHRALRYLGVILLGLFSVGLKKLLPDGNIWRAVRYFVIGSSITFLIPWLLLKLGWAQSSTRE